MTGSITYEQLKQLMQQLKIVAIRVLDTSGKRLYQDKEMNTEAMMSKLDAHKAVLEAYGRVQIICATETQFAQNWKDAYCYYVHFTISVASPMMQPNNMFPGMLQGFISPQQAELMATNKGLEMQIQFMDKMNKFEKLLDDKKSGDPMNFLPLAALFMDIPPEKMKQMMMMRMMDSPQAAALSGMYDMEKTPTMNKVTVEGTEAEKVNRITANMNALSEKTTLDKLVMLTDAINANPAYVDMALQFMTTQQTAKPLAGPEQKSINKKRTTAKRRTTKKTK